jgi:2-polyprenyl-3-methyl-5-hydroxy-6-metoxy-1,4-benzoquinol methylase
VLTVDYRRLGLAAGERLLDVGAGAGRHAFEGLRRGALVSAVDIDEAPLEDVAGFGVPCAAGSVLALPFDDGAFDRAIAAEVLEHVDDDRGALRELARVVRPGGVLAVTVPRWLPELVNWALTEEYHAPFVPGGHVRIYRESALRARMEAAGFEVFDRHHAHGLHAPYWWLKCAVGVRNDSHWAVRRYHDLLVREMTAPSLALRLAERALQPVVGKSLVLYGRRRHSNG